VSPDPQDKPKREYHHVLNCPCGERLTADTEDELVEISFEHLRERHPDMADTYEREHILFMSLKLPKPQ
jgi:predicted small metal-binding protein